MQAHKSCKKGLFVELQPTTTSYRTSMGKNGKSRANPIAIATPIVTPQHNTVATAIAIPMNTNNKEKIYMGSFIRLITVSKCGIKFTVDLKKDDPLIKIKETDNLNLCWKIESLKILKS